jgi:hypothetical protein
MNSLRLSHPKISLKVESLEPDSSALNPKSNLQLKSKFHKGKTKVMHQKSGIEREMEDYLADQKPANSIFGEQEEVKLDSEISHSHTFISDAKTVSRMSKVEYESDGSSPNN